MSLPRDVRRVFAIVVGVLVGVAALVVVLGGVLPRAWSVERSLLIQAPPADVFAFINDLDHWDEWAQWNRAALAPTNRVDEPSAGPGAALTWYEPSGRVAGQVRIVESDPVRGIVFESRVGSGDASRVSLSWAERGGLTLVTWRDEGRLPPIVGGLFRGVFQERLAAHMEVGLERLREQLKAARRSGMR